MIVHRAGLYCCIIFAFVLLPAGIASAHGGVVEEDDLCVIKVDYLRAHFKIYQPQVSAHKQYCEDLPNAAESVFVMEYQHDAMAAMPIDFRIVRDVTGKGRFARIEDVDAIANLDAVTVFYQAPVLEPDVFSVVYDFTEEGDYIGIVTARHPQSDKVYAAVFPFEVGFTGLGYWPFFIILLLLLQIQYLFMSGRLQRWWSRSAMASVACLLLLSPLLALADEYVVSYSTPDGTPQINRMYSWILHIEDAAGQPVEGAKITVTGGMPEHDHGLPTQPRVTADLGEGNYRLEGMRFHMAGAWELSVSITTDSGTSTILLQLQL